MKNALLLFGLGFFISLNIFGQTRDISKTSQDTVITKTSELYRNFDITIGYVPKSSYHALKTSFSANNILLQRVGGYVSIEKSLDSDFFSSTLGITTSLNKYIYLWGGVGFFAKSNLLNNMHWSDTRKELGIGIAPYKLSVIRIGWSGEVGPTITVGFKIPF